MGLFSDAAAMARGRLGAIFAIAALALVPAYLVGGGIVFVAMAHARSEMTGFSRGEAFAERSRSLPPDAAAEERRDVLTQARESGAPRPRSVSLALATAAVAAVLVFLAGLFFAQAALLPLAAGVLRPAGACAAVAGRFSAVIATTAAALSVVAVGLVACVVPGVFAAFVFSLAAGVAMGEGLSGFSALHRSWKLIKRVWPQQLALVVVTGALMALLTFAAGKLVPEGAALAHAVRHAAIAFVVLPLPAFASMVLYLRARCDADGKALDDVVQYIRRTSAPG
jgi:hypothetical protein